MKIPRVAFVFPVVILTGFAVYYATTSLLRSRINAECERALKTAAAAIRVYVAADAQHRYPSLSPVRGQLKMSVDLNAIWNPYANYSAGQTSNEFDKQFWYLGWIIPNERSGLEWLEQYLEHAPAFDKIDVPSPRIWPDCEADIAARQRVFNAEWRKTHPDGKRLPGENDRDGPQFAEPRLSEIQGYRPLQEGAWRWFAVWVQCVPTRMRYETDFPVLIERPERHGDGGHVLYMDGHVEFVPYPGKFPMTPKFIEGLRTLDNMESRK
jgi:prepilin-type processing-associated H-X9-DG protein